MYDFIKNNIPPGALFLRGGDYPLSFLGNKNIYLGAGSSLGVLHSHGINTQVREDLYKRILVDGDLAKSVKTLKKIGVNYIILDPETTPISTLSSQLYSYVYNDGTTKIIKLR